MFAGSIIWSGHRPDYVHPSITFCMLFCGHTFLSSLNFAFFHPPLLWKSLSVYISPFCWKFTTPLFVWLYPVNPGLFYLSLLIYIFQYINILFLLLSFAFRENWRLSEHVFVNCYQDFVLFLLLWFQIKKMGEWRASLNKSFPVAIKILFPLHKRFLQLSTPPFWKRMHDGVHEEWVWDKLCI